MCSKILAINSVGQMSVLHANAVDSLYSEDLAHMLLEYPAFIHQRKPIYMYSQIKNQVILKTALVHSIGKSCLTIEIA